MMYVIMYEKNNPFIIVSVYERIRGSGGVVFKALMNLTTNLIADSRERIKINRYRVSILFINFVFCMIKNFFS
jgi:hypothetical protein